MTRWLKMIFKATLWLMLAVAAGLGLWVFHTQPMYDGKLIYKNLSAPVEIKRDVSGVVHISANTDRDAAFALGFSHAQDRSWQLEFNRRVLRGELSEILGEATLPTDKLMRTLGLIQAAQQQLDRLPADVRDQLGGSADHDHSLAWGRWRLTCAAWRVRPAARPASRRSRRASTRQRTDLAVPARQDAPLDGRFHDAGGAGAHAQGVDHAGQA